MPTFEDMKKRSSQKHIGAQLREMSEMVMNETFSNNTGYRKGKLYDANMNEIDELEFKFHKVKTYTISKDQVEYHVQFRPGVNPEIDYPDVDYNNYLDKKYKFNYYIDIFDDDTKQYDKWLIVGKDTAEFDRYLVLKCNWTFEWLDHDGIYHNCLGCVRDRNSYNSGVWSDGFTTSVENQTMFIVPMNKDTMTIDYNIRFMITDNFLYPKVYEVTKVMDTLPVGCVKTILKQVHHNKHTDLCGIDKEHIYFDDNKIHMVADFYKSKINPDNNSLEHELCEHKEKELDTFNTNETWTLSEINEFLYVNGQSQTIKAKCDLNDAICKWYIFVDNEDYTNKKDELSGYLDINIDDKNNTFTITAINKIMANYIIKIGAGSDKNIYYDDFVEMEVCI